MTTDDVKKMLDDGNLKGAFHAIGVMLHTGGAHTEDSGDNSPPPVKK